LNQIEGNESVDGLRDGVPLQEKVFDQVVERLQEKGAVAVSDGEIRQKSDVI
jgi:hypothetical protein